MHAAEPVGDERHPRAVSVGAGELVLLTPQERARGGVRDRGDTGLEQRGGMAAELQ